MLDKLKNFVGKAKDVVSSTAVMVGDLNGDGKVDEEDARIAAEWAKKTASSIGKEAGRLGKEAMHSDLARDVGPCAALGAAVAIPIPIIGPMAGAAVGAGVGVYKNLTKKNQPPPAVPRDFYTELSRLDELRQKNIISEVEFEAQKKKILDAMA